MRLIKVSIYATFCILLFSCKKNMSSMNNRILFSTDDFEYDLEKVCLKSQNESMEFSMELKTDEIYNDYKFKYLGSLRVKKENFEVLQKTVLSGQNRDSQRALVSIRLFLNGNLYGEYTGMNKFYKIKISSNTICIWNYYTKSKSKYEIKDSIPKLLFFPYNDKDTLSSGDIFYFDKKYTDNSCED